MANPISVKIDFTKKLVLVLVGTAGMGVINAQSIQAQSQKSPLPKFEVASIKPCKLDDRPSSGGRGGVGVLGDPALFRTSCVTVRALIEGAFIRYANGLGGAVSMLKKQPLQGGPDWIDSDRYTVVAKPETPQTWAIMGGPMLQALLEDRFKLKIHRMIKEVPVYALVVSKGGSKLQATKEGGCTHDETHGPPPPVVPGQPLPCGYMGADANGINAVGVTIESLCQVISGQVHQAVIDKTGLTGLFDYHLGFTLPPPGGGTATDDTAASEGFVTATTALHKLGLELKSATGNAEFIVIDHLERPTEN
jgi:uncharacterized protein (TIGR03435 family)